MYGQSIGSLNLYQLIGQTETLIWTQSGNKGNSWLSGQVPVGNVTGYKIIVEGVSGNSYTGDIAIDDFKVNSGVSCQTTPALLVEPKLTVLKLSPVVRSFKGYEATWSVTGPPPIYTALIHNSTVLFNTTTTTGIFKLENDGNYTFVATNRFATDVKEFSVVVTDCGSQCSYQRSSLFGRNMLSCRSVTSIVDVTTCALVYTTAM